MRSPTAVVVIALCLVQGMVEVAAGGEKNLPNRNADKAASAVKLEFAAPLRRTERQILAEAGVEVAEYLGSNQYLALMPATSTALQEKIPFLRAVKPLTVAEKLGADLLAGRLPDHAKTADGQIKVRVQVFDSQKGIAGQVLARHSNSVRAHEASSAWDVQIPREKLQELAAEPIVKRVEAAPDPRLL